VKVKAAVIQMAPEVGHKADNVERSVELASRAAEAGAELIVMPELCNSGYVFQSREEAFELAEEVPGGSTCSAWHEVCREHGCYVVAGIAERAGAALYNAAVVLGPEGHLGTFRKLHLWNEENLYFEPGNLGLPVFHTRHGRIGTFICYDAWFPENFRICAVQGADLICVPTNWVPIPGQAPDQPAMANILCMANAHANSVYVLAADRVRSERGQEFLGRSVIVGYTGWPIAGPASSDQEEILTAEIDVAEARRNRSWNAFNQPLRDRRRDVYSETLGADVRVGWH
jgi:N-carbamoylputrescine amidase